MALRSIQAVGKMFLLVVSAGELSRHPEQPVRCAWLLLFCGCDLMSSTEVTNFGTAKRLSNFPSNFGSAAPRSVTRASRSPTVCEGKRIALRKFDQACYLSAPIWRRA